MQLHRNPHCRFTFGGVLLLLGAGIGGLRGGCKYEVITVDKARAAPDWCGAPSASAHLPAPSAMAGHLCQRPLPTEPGLSAAAAASDRTEPPVRRLSAATECGD